MICATCPRCGHDLERFETFELGHLIIEGNVAVYWKQRRLKLSPQERLYLMAIARANGALVPDHVIAEVIGYDGDDPNNIVYVLLSKLRIKFREIDPPFDSIERDGGAGFARGTRWRAEAHIIPELLQATATQRALHKLMLEHPDAALTEWAALQGRSSHSALYCILKALERRKLVRREKRYQRGWKAIGTLAMHSEIAASSNIM